MIPLGAVAKDKITGFEGVVVARTEWLNGCARLCIQPQALHEGKPVEDHTFDENQLVEVHPHFMKDRPEEPEALDEATAARSLPGGPRPDPVRQRDPVR